MKALLYSIFNFPYSSVCKRPLPVPLLPVGVYSFVFLVVELVSSEPAVRGTAQP
jgi:hypothetical protein